MLQKVVEDYLESIREIQFFLPFSYLLQLQGYYDVHITHGSVEFGKDIIAKKKNEYEEIQYVFQIKAGDIGYSKYRSEVRPQLDQALTNTISHSNFNADISRQVILVTTGVLNQHAAIDLQEHNANFVRKFFSNPVLVVDRLKLVKDFVDIGIEPFFSTHDNPQFVGEFFQMYSKIKNMSRIGYLDVVFYTQRWLEFECNDMNRLQVFFESYMFSSMLLKCEMYYEAAQFIAALVRFLLKNNLYDYYSGLINEYFIMIVDRFIEDLDLVYMKYGQIYKSKNINGILAIFKYPVFCFRALELISMCLLIHGDTDDKYSRYLCRLIDTERGWERPLSDNYAASIALTSLSLIKISKINYLKKFITNITIWLCDRYTCFGLASIGSSEECECEQLLSEYLTGLYCKKNCSSFIASILLDISYLSKDKSLYEDVANDLRASSIITEFYHVINDEDVYHYDNIETSNDPDFSKEFIDDYSSYICFERNNSNITINNIGIFYLIFLLRDRMFPTFITELL